MIYQYVSYRSYLKEVLAERVKRNSKYSLRAMAKHLGVSSSALSEIMNGLANFSLNSARKIATKLDLSNGEVEYFCSLVQLESSRDPEVRESLLEKIKSLNPNKPKAHDLSVDLFKQRSEWYYSAILAMFQLSQTEMTSQIISKRLGISKIEAEVAVDCLIRLDLLERNKAGKITLTHAQFMTQSDASNNEALRKFYRQMMQKAGDALENQSTKERISGYETLAIANEALPEAKEIIEKCFQDIASLSEKYPKRKNVYHLVLHFFNLTHGKD
jgi:uncharacterized protein (TIGR02147 family)